MKASPATPTRSSTRRSKEKHDETPGALTYWYGDGHCGADLAAPRGTRYPSISIGRTDSKRALGFEVTESEERSPIVFVLNRAQIQDLVEFCRYQLRRITKGKEVSYFLRGARQEARRKAREKRASQKRATGLQARRSA